MERIVNVNMKIMNCAILYYIDFELWRWFFCAQKWKPCPLSSVCIWTWCAHLICDYARRIYFSWILVKLSTINKLLSFYLLLGDRTRQVGDLYKISREWRICRHCEYYKKVCSYHCILSESVKKVF